MAPRRSLVALALLVCASGTPVPLVLLCSAGRAAAQEAGAADPGFVKVPEGNVVPGCTDKNLRARAKNAALGAVLPYERWGDLPYVTVRDFWIGRYEVTNAQWKAYLDANFRKEYATSGDETLGAIANRYVSYRGDPAPSEWVPMFVLNADAVSQAIPDWAAVAKSPERIGGVVLPKDVKLTFYTCRTPRHWYAWHPLFSNVLTVGREFVDIRKAPAEAFQVPNRPEFKRPDDGGDLLRDTDFSRHPIRDVALSEMFAFAEWAGCQLPTEYEWVRAGKGDWPIEDVYPFRGGWDQDKQKTVFAWFDHPRCHDGPLAVDDPAFQPGDGPFGTRHQIGNVTELTRTFYDHHPDLTGRTAPPIDGLFNYSLVAKGFSFGDGSAFMQLSARSGVVGRSPTSLQNDNPADTLGLRLVHHPRPCWDLLLHSIFRMAYNAKQATWNAPRYPHAYAMPLSAGMDTTKIHESPAPYVHARARAVGIGVAPLWFTDLDAPTKAKIERALPSGKPERDAPILGVLRTDLAFRAGVKLAPADVAALEKSRADYEEFLKKSKQKPKKGDPPLKEVPKPPDPDEYEKLTAKHAASIGLWREATVPAGEWLLVYWNGFLGLANKTLVMPPDAVILLDRQGLARDSSPSRPATLEVDADRNRITFTLWADEELDPRKPAKSPDVGSSDRWALCETVDPNWTGWPGRKPGKASWRLTFTLRYEDGALKAHEWNR